jgi:hypothetical protein
MTHLIAEIAASPPTYIAGLACLASSKHALLPNGTDSPCSSRGFPAPNTSTPSNISVAASLLLGWNPVGGEALRGRSIHHPGLYPGQPPLSAGAIFCTGRFGYAEKPSLTVFIPKEKFVSEERLLTIRELAERLQMSVVSVRFHVRYGRIPVIRFNTRTWRFHWATVLDALRKS